MTGRLPHPTATTLQLYADEQLEAQRQRGVEAHLAECENCRTAAAELRTLFRDLDGLPELAISPAFLEGVIQQVAQSADPVVIPARRDLLLPLAVGCALLLGLCVLMGVFERPLSSMQHNLPGAIDLVLGSPFETAPAILAGFSLLALAGLALIALVLARGDVGSVGVAGTPESVPWP
ncbi:MAG: anti-sigma factor family protein [Chloroflexota bacterium]